MAEQFIGMNVALTLTNNARLNGTVADVDSATQILHLRDGNHNNSNLKSFSSLIFLLKI